VVRSKYVSSVPAGVLSTQYSVLCIGLAVLVGITATACGRVSAEDVLRAFPVAEPSFLAEIAGIDSEWNLSFKASGKVRVVAAADLAYFGRYRDVEMGPQIVLADRSIIRADPLLMDENQLILGDATGLGRGQWEESSLPKRVVKAVVLQPPAATKDRDRLLHDLMSSGEVEDRLLLVSGETIMGTIVALPRAGKFAPEVAKPGLETIQIVRRGSAEALVIPVGKVTAITFGATTHSAPMSQKLSAWLGFADGSLVQAASFTAKDGALSLGLSAGGQMKTAIFDRDEADRKVWHALTYVEPVSPRVTWLSDLTPLGYKHIPFLSIERPFGADQNVLGSRMRVRGNLCRKGLGMPSAARLAYDVSGYRKLDAEIAVDDEAGLRGSVVFKVLLETRLNEWQVAYESPVVRGGDAPLPVSVDLKGASRLALLTDFADRGDECDWADWLHARLIK
jgi:hypothetical protein